MVPLLLSTLCTRLDVIMLGLGIDLFNCLFHELIHIPQGKTLTMLALILSTKSDVPRDFSKCTLIGKCFLISQINQSSTYNTYAYSDTSFSPF